MRLKPIFDYHHNNTKKINKLIPDFQPKARTWVDLADHWLSQNKPFKPQVIFITDALRDGELQAGLFSEGRSWDRETRLWTITKPAEVKTHTMESLHLKGQAFDYALCNSQTYELTWPDPEMDVNLQMYLSLGQIAKELGLFPGSHWAHTRPDFTHIGYRLG